MCVCERERERETRRSLDYKELSKAQPKKNEERTQSHKAEEADVTHFNSLGILLQYYHL